MLHHAGRPLIFAAVLGLALAGPTVTRSALPDNFDDQLVVSGLNQPSSFAFLPDGRLIIVEQKTRNILIAPVGSTTATTLLTITDVNTSGTERGLLGVAVDPDWPASPYIYVHFSQTPTIKMWVARYTASGNLTTPTSTAITLGSRYVILNDVPDAALNHNGGTLRFGPDKMLYASFGEDADPCGAQDSTTFKGVILRLDVGGLPAGAGGPPAKLDITPADNPFVGGANPNAGLVWAFGLRNPFRFHVDAPTGHLFIADVGNNTWEEIDECAKGENFGWPYYEGPALVGGGCPPQSPYTPPIATVNRVGVTASIISVGRYRTPGGVHSFPPSHEGDYFYSDYYAGWVRRIRYDGANWVPAPAAAGQPNATDWASDIVYVSDWLTGADGAVYYCKQFSSPSIRRIVYVNPSGVDDAPRPRPVQLSVFPNPFSAGGPGGVTLTLSGGAPGRSEVTICDAAGRLVRRLAEVTTAESRLAWDGRDDLGAPAPAGVYFVTVRGASHGSARVVLARP